VEIVKMLKKYKIQRILKLVLIRLIISSRRNYRLARWQSKSTVGSKPWAVAEWNSMINQAQKYSSGFEGDVIYHTNSVELATHYTDMFLW
jgi:hypothetical protein